METHFKGGGAQQEGLPENFILADVSAANKKFVQGNTELFGREETTDNVCTEIWEDNDFFPDREI
ncbi:hypothetical protein [Pedobacter sp.]|uniref:hypothetical protein n=1 Tax=Pedobacter sp. TaxID=1411316 RepID=UPI003C66C7CC